MAPALEVADIFRRHGAAFRQAHAGHLGCVERRIMSAITACRTAALGGHVEQCDDCGAKLGMTMVLHTWGQTLHHHPHVHCVVPGGGPSLDGTRWVTCRPGFLLPVRLLARLFRRLFLRELENAFNAGKLRFFTSLANLAEPQAFARRLRELRRLDWVVYAKPPFGGPEQVLAYLGRYTHRVAIANSRLLSLADGKIRFTWKDYRADGKTKVMTLDEIGRAHV